MSWDKNERVNVVIAGSRGVGKRKIAKAFAGHKPIKNEGEADFFLLYEKEVTVAERLPVDLHLHCLSTKETKPFTLGKVYAPAHAVIFVYDVSKPRTFDVAKEKYKAFQEYNNDCPVILVGNQPHKTERKVKKEDALNWANANRVHYAEVFSNGKREDIQDLFERVAYEAYSFALDKNGLFPLDERKWSEEENWSDEKKTQTTALNPVNVTEKMKDAHAKLSSYSESLITLKGKGCSKNHVERGKVKGRNLKRHLDNKEVLEYYELNTMLRNENKMLDNRSKLPFKPYRVGCFFRGKYNPVLDRYCQSRTEELLVDYYKAYNEAKAL